MNHLFYTAGEIADILTTTPFTVYSFIGNGLLPSIKIEKSCCIEAYDFEEFITSQRIDSSRRAGA